VFHKSRKEAGKH